MHLCATHVALACKTLWVHNAVSAGVCVGGGGGWHKRVW